MHRRQNVSVTHAPLVHSSVLSSAATATGADVQRYYRRSFILVLIISAIFLCITLSIVASLIYCWCKRAACSKKRDGAVTRVDFAECADADVDEEEDVDEFDSDDCDALSSVGVAPLAAGNNIGLQAGSDKRRLIPRSRSTETHCSMYSNGSFVNSEGVGGGAVLNRAAEEGPSRSLSYSDGLRNFSSRTQRFTRSPLRTFGEMASALYSRVLQRRRSQTQFSTQQLLDDMHCSVLSEPQSQQQQPQHCRSESQLVAKAPDERVLFERAGQPLQKRIKVSALLRGGSQRKIAASACTQETAI